MKFKTTILLFITLFFVACSEKTVLDENQELTVDKVNLVLTNATPFAEISITKGTGKYSVATSDPQVAQSLLLGEKLYITGNNIGSSIITLGDDKGNQVKISVVVNEYIARTVPVSSIVFIKKGASKSFSVTKPTTKYLATDTTTVLQFQESAGNVIVTGLKTGKTTFYCFENYWPNAIYDCRVVEHYDFMVAPSTTSTRIALGNEAEVYIHTGNGDYTVASSNSTAVSAELRPWPITPTIIESNPMIVHYKGTAVGTSTLTITDKETGLSKALAVTVY